MGTNNNFKNILNVIINIFTGWLTFWIFFYSWFFITDRKDAEAESFVPVGYAMLATLIIMILWCFLSRMNTL